MSYNYYINHGTFYPSLIDILKTNRIYANKYLSDKYKQ